MKNLIILFPFLLSSLLLAAQNRNRCLVILNDKDCINCNRPMWGISQINNELETFFVIPIRMESFFNRLVTEVGNLPKEHIKIIINDSIYERYSSIYPRTTLLIESYDGKILYDMPLYSIFDNLSVVNAFSNTYIEFDTIASITHNNFSQDIKLTYHDHFKPTLTHKSLSKPKNIFLLDQLFGEIWKIQAESGVVELILNQSALNVDSLRFIFNGEWTADLDSAKAYDPYLKIIGYDKPTIITLTHQDTSNYALVRCPYPKKEIENNRVTINVEHIHLIVRFDNKFYYKDAIALPRRFENGFSIYTDSNFIWADSLIYFSIYRYEPEKFHPDDPIVCAFHLEENNKVRFSHFLELKEPKFFIDNGLRNELDGRYLRNGLLFYAHVPQIYNIFQDKPLPMLDMPFKNQILSDDARDFPLSILDVKILKNELTLILTNVYDKKFRKNSIVLYYFNTKNGSLIDERVVISTGKDEIVDAVILPDLDILLFSKSQKIIRVR